jgi:hypothetical protein
MKKRLLLIFFLMLSNNSYGGSFIDFSLSDFCYQQPGVQDRGGVYYFPNEEEGITDSSLCVYKDLYGQYMDKVDLVNGKFHGQFIRWWENGQKHQEKNYINGKLDGKWTDWWADGRVFFEKNYKDGNLVSETNYMYHDNLQIKSIINSKGNNLDGKTTLWGENGQIQLESIFKDGELITEINWDKNAQESNYKDGKLDSIVERYENGQKKSAMYYGGLYWNGHYEGWHDNGIKSYKGVFYMQRFNAKSEHINWDRDGNVESFGNLDIQSFKSRMARGEGLENAYKVGLWTYFKDGEKVLKNNELTNFIDGIRFEDKFNYISNVTAKIRSKWRYQGAEDNWRCMVYILRDRDGTIQSVDVLRCHVGDSNQAKAFKNSIERAVYKSSPLPAPPYDDNFDNELTIDFTVN